MKIKFRGNKIILYLVVQISDYTQQFKSKFTQNSAKRDSAFRKFKSPSCQTKIVRIIKLQP